MPKPPWLALTPCLLLAPLGAGHSGGWAIITVEDPPEYLVAGRPISLRFTVRQHGAEPLSGLKPSIEARSSRVTPRIGSIALPESRAAGQYVATFTLPAPGDWTLTIQSGFGNSRLTLLPIPAIAAGTSAPAPLAGAERGRQLFVAKGCVGCHTRAEAGLEPGGNIGPNLTGKRYEAGFLGRFLADPGKNPTLTGSFRMPKLDLRPAEIGALTAFLNGERTETR